MTGVKAPLPVADVLKRLRKLQAVAVNVGATSHEAASAARFFIMTLNQHHPPIRFCYPRGTVVRVLPVGALDTAQARTLIRATKAHRPGAFVEMQRVTDADVVKSSLANGYLPFRRYGYFLFVPLAALDLRL